MEIDPGDIYEGARTMNRMNRMKLELKETDAKKAEIAMLKKGREIAISNGKNTGSHSGKMQRAVGRR